jgi:hypothetical protein
MLCRALNRLGLTEMSGPAGPGKHLRSASPFALPLIARVRHWLGAAGPVDGPNPSHAGSALRSPLELLRRDSLMMRDIAQLRTVRLAGRIGRLEVLSTASQLRIEAPSGNDLSLDLSAVVEVDPSWGAVLSMLLIRELRSTRRLYAHLPATPSAQAALVRAGLLMVLAQHRGMVKVDPPSWHSHLKTWSADWRPSDIQAPVHMPPGEPAAEGDRDLRFAQMLAFLNPDRQPAGDATGDLRAVVHPWLHDLIGPEANAAAIQTARHRIEVTQQELLDNVREHALLSRHDHAWLSFFAHQRRPDRLNVCMADTGIGMLRSLRKLAGNGALTDSALLSRALSGGLPLRGRSRGRGLSRLASVVGDSPGARLFLATGPARNGGALVLETVAPSGPLRIDNVPDLPLRGTIVLIGLPLPTSGDPVGEC